ncbi:class I SAM-dependent methyltransferase [Tenacibaculum sp. SG-28]|uniref:THUMP-like domain-containing protein n=1 Tax=Tenacibaculum sp. SG-28 TaxID=754426 RepID=UPI002680774C
MPTWFSTRNILYPPKLNIEQTSSEATAFFKSNLIHVDSLIDITGGFGVDCFYFSKGIHKVIHCEINEKLSKIVSHNYKQLGITNIQTVALDGISFLQNNNSYFDCIYIDPSRRNDTKGKVFLIQDCQPNIPANIDFLFTKSKTIFIKYSPMLDISLALEELKFVKEIHVVALKNEVKELLFIVEKGFTETIKMFAHNMQNNSKVTTFSFEYPALKKEIKYSFPAEFLYEPNAAILKSGGFNEVAFQYNIAKLHPHSHLYTSPTFLSEFPGRKFKIQKIFKYHKKNIRKEISEKQANISVRNFPKSVAQIRKETKLKDGGSLYLFFTKNMNNELIVIHTHKVL